MAITANFVRSLSDFKGSAKLWKLSEPVEYDRHGHKTEHVITSAVVAYSGPETYIFPASPGGEPISFGDMDGSFQGALDHEAAISGAGWLIKL